jgi:hypothetical protein
MIKSPLPILYLEVIYQMKQYFLIFCALFLISACTQESDDAAMGKYGMMNESSPQYTAVMFIRAIYNQETLDEAVRMADERFARLMLNQHTNNNVQRHILNLRLDTMTVEPLSGGTLLSTEKQVDADITVKIIGRFDHEQIVDLKTISMIQQSGEWLVTDIKDTLP